MASVFTRLNIAVPEVVILPFAIEKRKIIFRKQLAIVMILIIFYVILGAESDSGICFYPSRLDFAVQEVAIFQYDVEWHYSVQQNLDVLEKMYAGNGFSDSKNIENDQNHDDVSGK